MKKSLVIIILVIFTTPAIAIPTGKTFCECDFIECVMDHDLPLYQRLS